MALLCENIFPYKLLQLWFDKFFAGLRHDMTVAHRVISFLENSLLNQE